MFKVRGRDWSDAVASQDVRDWGPRPRAGKRKDGFHLQSQGELVLLIP